MKKGLCRFILLIVVLGLAIPLSAVPLAAQEFAGGTGSSEHPYQIANWYHLDSVRSHLGDHFVLLNDLDDGIDGYSELAGPAADENKGWQPIGGLGNEFSGTFDGQRYEIRDLAIDRPQDGVGLFGCVSGGSIESVGIVNAQVTANDWVGTLVGVNDGIVSNCCATGNVSAHAMCGGLVGCNGNTGTVEYCHSTCTVSCSWNDAGGLVGYNDGEVTHCYATGDVAGGGAAGGLVGHNPGVVSSGHATGTVSGSVYVGGMVGLSSGTVGNCYAIGEVTGTERVGGFMGRNSGTVSNCYAVGGVSGSLLTGGLIGQNDGNVENCFWDTQTSGMATSDGGTGKTARELKQLATFTGWDVSEVTFGVIDSSRIWNLIDCHSYPFLAWFDMRFDLKAGWNMVSVPRELPAGKDTVEEVFKGEIEAIYTWNPTNRSYTVPDTVEANIGYWVAAVEDKTISCVMKP